MTTYDWIKSFLKITIEGRAIFGNLAHEIIVSSGRFRYNKLYILDLQIVLIKIMNVFISPCRAGLSYRIV